MGARLKLSRIPLVSPTSRVPRRRSRLAYTPRASATAAIDTPSCWLAPTASIFRAEFVKGVEGKIQQRASEKLKYLDAAASLGDLRVVPGNQLEALKDDRKGQYSVRVNQQSRLGRCPRSIRHRH